MKRMPKPQIKGSRDIGGHYQGVKGQGMCYRDMMPGPEIPGTGARWRKQNPGIGRGGGKGPREAM